MQAADRRSRANGVIVARGNMCRKQCRLLRCRSQHPCLPHLAVAWLAALPANDYFATAAPLCHHEPSRHSAYSRLCTHWWSWLCPHGRSSRYPTWECRGRTRSRISRNTRFSLVLWPVDGHVAADGQFGASNGGRWRFSYSSLRRMSFINSGSQDAPRALSTGWPIHWVS